MKKVFASLIFTLLSVAYLVFVNFGCNVKEVKPDPETIASAKPQGSIFTVIELEDVEYPTVETSIHLPFRVRPNNTVVISGKYAYVTTERHLHVIDVSSLQRPSYLTSLEFADEIGKAVISGNRLVVASPQEFHLVDISQPSHPVLQSTMYLPQRNAIKDFDVRGLHLYVMGANDSLYIFSIALGQARLVKVVEMSPRWWLFSPKEVRSGVEQVLLSTSDDTFLGGLSEALLSRRGFLQLSSSLQEKVRASSDFLVQESLISTPTTCDLLIYDAYRISDIRIRTGVYYYDMGRECLDHFSATGQKALTRSKPMVAYAVSAGKMQQIPQGQLCETIDINDRLTMGPVTDFQISGDLLYVTNAKGFFSIIRLVKSEAIRKGDRINFVSIAPLQACRPMSVAVGEQYAYVLAAPENSQR